MMRILPLAVAALCSISLLAIAEEPPSPTEVPKELILWQKPGDPRLVVVNTAKLPGEAHDRWLNTWPHIVRVHSPRDEAGKPTSVPFIFSNTDPNLIRFDLPAPAARPEGDFLGLLLADKSEQGAKGIWAFVASDAKVHGQRAALESHPGNFRIGFWTNPDDFVTWDFTATRWGMYEVEVTYSLAGGNGSDISVSIGDAKVTGTIKPTASWWHYTTVSLGKMYLPDAGKKTLTVRGTKTGAAVMNLKAVILSPAPEGADWPIKPADDGLILLHSKDARVDGITLRYEPKPEKNTLGFWSNANDWAAWVFDSPAAEYDVELMQGCGKGHGGSEVEVHIDDQVLKFTVEDTGGWQSFKPRIIGRVKLPAGAHTLTLAPVRKAGAAVMDVRQVRLIPVKN